MASDQPGMIAAALHEIRAAFQARWVALIGAGATGTTVILAQQGEPPTDLGPFTRLLDNADPALALDDTAGALICPLTLPPNQRAMLVVRPTGGWSPKDGEPLRLAADLLRVMWEYGIDESGLDRLTGLPNQPYFLAETDRHIERLDQERAPGTMMLIELGDLEPIVRVFGPSARDQALIRVGTLIRAMFRPADIVGRLAAASFGVWLDGVDHMTAAERAETLCARRLSLPETPNRPAIPIPPLSIGIASRLADSDDDAREVLLRAHDAVAVVRRTEGGGWHVLRGAS